MVPAASLTDLLLAGIAGGGITAIAAVVGRRSQYAREDHARWLTERRDAYVELLAALDDVWIPALLITKGGRDYLEDASDERRQLDDASARIRRAADTLALLAPPRVLSALHDLRAVLRDIRLIASGHPGRDRIDRDELMRRLGDAGQALRIETRRDLGLRNTDRRLGRWLGRLSR